MIAHDTSVLVDAVDASSGPHRKRAALLQSRAMRLGRLPLAGRMIAEFASVAIRKLQLNPLTMRQRIHDFMITSYIEPYDDDDVDAALDLVARESLSFWDSLALSAGDRVGVRVFATEGLQGGRRHGRTVVPDPSRDDNLPRLGLGLSSNRSP